jgi:hypothetical protein
MSSVCCACQHANPADAKFCNECGCPLGLKPCAQCDAINGVGASECQRCGADLRDAELRDAELRDAEVSAAAELSLSRSTVVASRAQTARVANGAGRFSADTMSVVDGGPSMLADRSLPPDGADAANVDFLLFPTSQAQGLESGKPDATGATNVDFLIFPTPQTSNGETEGQENGSSRLSAEPPGRDASGSAPLGQTPLSLLTCSPARRDEASGNSAHAPIEPASPGKHRRPAMLALALLLVVCAAGFFGVQYGNRFDRSPDRRAQGPMSIDASPIELLSRRPATSTESVKLTPGADEEQGVSAKASPSKAIDAVETEPVASTVQPGIANEAVVRGGAPSARDVSERVTPQARGTNNAKPTRSLVAAAGRAKVVPRKSVAEPPQQRSPVTSCADSVTALGLCGETSRR